MKYPEREIPLYPLLNCEFNNGLERKKDSLIPSVVDSGVIYSTINARSALKIGLMSMQLNIGDEILVPSYHCPVMIYPIVDLGYKPVFYNINKDCSVDIKDFKKKITNRTKATIVVHFFGFPSSSLFEICSICNANNIYLIEDCAHAFYGYCGTLPIGSIGDFSIVSLYKFFPVCHGGFLKFENKELAMQASTLHSPLFFQFKSLLNTIEMKSDVNKKKGFQKVAFQLKDWIWDGLKSTQRKANPQLPVMKKIKNPYSPELMADSYSLYKMPIISKLVYKNADKNKLIYRRRKNYQILLKKLKNISGIRPLFIELPPLVVPYDFPLVSQKADKISKELKSKQVYIGRFAEYSWNEMHKDTCSVSSFYSKHCIQLPIHQSLTSEDMNYMASIIEKFI